ncbi:MAG: amidohydrolase family protein [Rhodomicrobium sp.]
MRKVALEEHFTTPGLSRYAVGPKSSLASSFFGRFEERLLEFGELRLQAMDNAGIEVAVLSVTTPGVQAEKDTGVAIKLAREANDFLAGQIEKQPARYAGFAHLPMQDADAAANELERCVRELRFKAPLGSRKTFLDLLGASSRFAMTYHTP